jgi:hypothetical protein
MRFLRNTIAAAGLALSMLAAAGTAFAQVIPSTSTTTRQPSPRQFGTEQVHYIRSTLTFNMCVQSSNACKVKLANANLPYNAVVLQVRAIVYTAFNSTTSDVITLGTTSTNANEIVSSSMNIHAQADVTGTLVSTHFNNTGNTVAQSGSNGGLDLWVLWTAGTGNTATAGLVSLIVTYVAPNDGNCTPNIALGAAPAGC